MRFFILIIFRAIYQNYNFLAGIRNNSNLKELPKNQFNKKKYILLYILEEHCIYLPKLCFIKLIFLLILITTEAF